jgi:hypothetical protein
LDNSLVMINIICNQQKKKRRVAIIVTPPVIPNINNQPAEGLYFNSHLLPISEKANIQAALNSYGAVRLEKGDYSGVPITLGSNQRLYGNPATTSISNITIAAGSSNVIIENVAPAPSSSLSVTFQAGGVISNCMIKNTRGCEILAVNASMNNNTFINVEAKISLDCSVSGYFRNTKIIKHKVQSQENMLILKGNTVTPSYGTVGLHSNYLTSFGETTNLDGLQSATFIGLDCESYGGLTRELFYAKNIGKLEIMALQGGMLYNSPFGYYNVDAANLNVINAFGGSNTPSVINPRTKLFELGSNGNQTVTSGAVTGYEAQGYTTESPDRVVNQHLYYNQTDQLGLITDTNTVSNITSSILGTPHTPWDRPSWGVLPDPLGSNWREERIGKPDSKSYIQGLINTNGIAELPEGIFYIGSTLNIPLDKLHGIVGKGTGKTVIVGLTDDFPLITTDSDYFGYFTLSYLTLQGGSSGLRVTSDGTFLAYNIMNYVVFRDQNYGIHLDGIFGCDNNFFSDLGFVNCNKGIFQNPFPNYVPGVLEGSTYVDKTVFYRNQFINCDTSVSMIPTRANNMNAWIDCSFNGGSIAADMGGDSTFFANCDFKNFNGNYILKSNGFNLISCEFQNNTTYISTIKAVGTTVEGCTFLDNNKVFSPDVNNSVVNIIKNSTLTGEALTLMSAETNKTNNALFINSTLLSNPTLSKLLVKVSQDVPTVLINTASTPYPQLLVTQ